MKKTLSKLYKASATTVAGTAGLLASAQTALAQFEFSQEDLPSGFFDDFGTLLTSAVRIVFVIAVLLVFFYLIWGGIEWITSGGDKGQTEKARNKITAAVVGLIILAASFAILTLALNFLGYGGGLQDVISEFDSST